MRKFTIHILSLPHTRINDDYSHCAFTQKAKRLAIMLHDRGHTVYLYGSGEDDHKFCTEYIPIFNDKQFAEWFPKREVLDWNNPERWALFNQLCSDEIKKRANRGDLVASTFGNLQQPCCENSNCIPIETGIGYTGVFAPFQVFESYALRNYLTGLFQGMSNPRHHDTVIPNYYNLEDFDFTDKPKDYFLFIGRLNEDKGFATACRAAKMLGAKIKMAGVIGHQGLYNEVMSYGNVEYLGVLNTQERKEVMRDAIATFVPTIYLEPFGGVHIESLLSGTPVLTSDVGVFPETVQNGFNGYRCTNLAEFVEGAKNIHKIDRQACRSWAQKNFALDVIAPRYEYYFQKAYNVYSGDAYDSLNVTVDVEKLNAYFK